MKLKVYRSELGPDAVVSNNRDAKRRRSRRQISQDGHETVMKDGQAAGELGEAQLGRFFSVRIDPHRRYYVWTAFFFMDW